MKKLVIWYLKRVVKDLGFQEESLEINQDLIHNVNEIWQYTRKSKTSVEDIISHLNSVD